MNAIQYFALALLQLPQNMLNPGGSAADSISKLTWAMLICFIAVTAVMWVLIWIAASKRQGSFLEHARVDAGGGHGWILIGGFAVPFVILATFFIIGLRDMAAFPMRDGEIPDPEIRIIGHQWWWEVQYIAGPPDKNVTTANEIHIPAGQFVDIELRTADVIHSFWVPRLHGKVDLIPGQPNTIRIRADAPGTYRGECAEFCGAQHSHMILLVVADTPDDYAAWLAHQREPAAVAATAEQQLGEQMFMSRPCAFCHAIRGTPARGGVAPDLTHIGSRQAIASNMLKNDSANLEAWVTHAQSLKPEVMMPNVTQFSGQELRALVAYLQQLR